MLLSKTATEEEIKNFALACSDKEIIVSLDIYGRIPIFPTGRNSLQRISKHLREKIIPSEKKGRGKRSDRGICISTRRNYRNNREGSPSVTTRNLSKISEEEDDLEGKIDFIDCCHERQRRPVLIECLKFTFYINI